MAAERGRSRDSVIILIVDTQCQTDLFDIYLKEKFFCSSVPKRKKSVQPKTSFSCPGRHLLFSVQNAKCFPPILLSRLVLEKFSCHWYQDYFIGFGQWIKCDPDSICKSCNVLRFKHGTNLLVTSNFPFRYWKKHPDYKKMKLSKIFAGPLTRKMCAQKRKKRKNMTKVYLLSKDSNICFTA